MDNITVVLLEKLEATIFCCSVSNGAIEVGPKTVWSPKKYLIDSNGKRLIDEIARRVKIHWKEHNVSSDYVVVSLPGTLQNEVRLVSSSRLGIREPVNFSESLNRKLRVNCYIYHDTKCLITGEIKHGDYFKDEPPSSLVYIFVDEGVGSEIIIDGKPYLGMGTAGLLGRLIVQPEGAYYPDLRSSGSLEVYSSRPWVSRRLVEVYHSEIGKKGYVLPDDIEYSKFRQALTIAAKGDWTDLQYSNIAAGISANDPIALHVIDNAAKYLGYSINSIITLINPEMIILAGAMISELPLFSERAVNYARQFSWPTAWNNTEINISKYGRMMQVYGAVELCQSTVEK